MLHLGTIYKIIHLQGDSVYIGMTLGNPANRWQQHKQACFQESSKDLTIYPIMREHGIDQFKLVVIKTYEVVDKDHLSVYESLWINKLTCVNRCVSFNPIPKTEYRRLINAKYVENNREAVLEQKRRYVENNREAVLERSRLHYVNNKESHQITQARYYERNKKELNERNRLYYESNAKRLNEKHPCECGRQYSINGKLRHFKTAYHMRFLNARSATTT